MNVFQKVAQWALSKAVGFPPWTSATWPTGMYWGNQGNAEQLAVIYGCCRVRGQTIGSLPLHIYRKDSKGNSDIALDHPLYKVLNRQPSQSMNSFEWRENMERNFCLYGNAYSVLGRTGKQITSIEFLEASRVHAYMDIRAGLLYRYTYWNGRSAIFAPQEILHIKNMSADGGIMGQSPLLKYVMEHALSAQSYGLNFLRNGARPSGYLQFAGKRPNNDATVEKIKSDWQENYGGTENSGRTAVTWEGTKYETIGVNPEEAQLLETAKLLTGDIAGAIFGVPRNMLGQASETSSYASSEQFARDFVLHTVSPQCNRYEQALNRALFVGEPDVFCQFDVEAIQRGDSQSQAAYYSSLVQNGLMTRNEARRKLGLPEIAGADELTVQSNLIDLDKLLSATNRADLTPKPQGASQP